MNAEPRMPAGRRLWRWWMALVLAGPALVLALEARWRGATCGRTFVTAMRELLRVVEGAAVAPASASGETIGRKGTAEPVIAVAIYRESDGIVVHVASDEPALDVSNTLLLSAVAFASLAVPGVKMRQVNGNVRLSRGSLSRADGGSACV